MGARVDAAHLGVAASDGEVTLTGDVASYSEKTAAVEAAERVYGVASVADLITVKIPGETAPDDPQMTQAAADALGVTHASLRADAWPAPSAGFGSNHGGQVQCDGRTRAVAVWG